MSIDRLVALEEGNPSNSNGSDIASSVNATIDGLEWVLAEAHACDMDELTGNSFAASIGSVALTGMSA